MNDDESSRLHNSIINHKTFYDNNEKGGQNLERGLARRKINGLNEVFEFC